MLELIISVLMSMGYNAQGGNHFKMNSQDASQIQHIPTYKSLGGDEQFFNYVTIDDNSWDVVITDDDNPKE